MCLPKRKTVMENVAILLQLCHIFGTNTQGQVSHLFYCSSQQSSKMHKWVDPGFFSRHSGTSNKWPSWCLHWQKEGLLLETAMLNYHSQGIRHTFFNPVSCFSPTQTNCWVFLYRCKKSAGHLRGMGCTSPASLPWISPLQGMVYLKLLAVQKLGGKRRWSWPKKSSTDLYTDPKFKMTK